MATDFLVNDFAIRCFRDVGDEDYISARMAFRSALVTPSLWASQQTVEKYLKCILLLNRIPGVRIKHNLCAALDAINGSGKITLDLTRPTTEFIHYLDEFGRFRYLEVSNVAFGGNLTRLDRAVWELRRFCTLDKSLKQIKLRNGETPVKVRIPAGYLEKIIADKTNLARAPLLWNNAFFGLRPRRSVKIHKWMTATNAPLYLNPQILDEVLKYVYLPREIVDGYRAHTSNTLQAQTPHQSLHPPSSGDR